MVGVMQHTSARLMNLFTLFLFFLSSPAPWVSAARAILQVHQAVQEQNHLGEALYLFFFLQPRVLQGSIFPRNSMLLSPIFTRLSPEILDFSRGASPGIFHASVLIYTA